MRLKNVLIVVKDIEKSRQFYHDLFGLDRKWGPAGTFDSNNPEPLLAQTGTIKKTDAILEISFVWLRNRYNIGKRICAHFCYKLSRGQDG